MNTEEYGKIIIDIADKAYTQEIQLNKALSVLTALGAAIGIDNRNLTDDDLLEMSLNHEYITNIFNVVFDLLTGAKEGLEKLQDIKIA